MTHLHLSYVPWEIEPSLRFTMANEASTCWSKDMPSAIEERLNDHGIRKGGKVKETFKLMAQAGCLIITFDNENT